MREIKFRGKRIDNGEWAYGYYLSYATDVYSCGEIIGTKDEHYIITPCHEDFNYEHTFEVDLETVGQYTGLKYKNGDEIFEGDVIEWFSPNSDTDGSNLHCKVVVVWDGVGFDVKGYENGLIDFLKCDEGEIVKIIGNVHDNPELVGESNV